MSGAIAQRANETTKALGGKVSYLWATLAVFVALAELPRSASRSTARSAAAGCTTSSSRTAATSAAG